MQVRFLGREGPSEEGMPTYSSILAWRIPRTEEPGGLQSIGLQRAGHDRSDLASTRQVRSQFPNQELNPCSLQWKCGVLTTGPPGKLHGL